MIDWDRYSRLLTDGTDGAMRKFLAQHPGTTLSAIGYTFELWNLSPAFNLCANTHLYFRQMNDRYRTEWPNVEVETLRWSSGDYQFCSSLLTGRNELGSEWESQYLRLHNLAKEDNYSREVYDGLVRICCAALARLVKGGAIGDWKQIDFNVSEYGDDIELVKQRDQRVRSLIENGG